jgi:hypothetical protein
MAAYGLVWPAGPLQCLQQIMQHRVAETQLIWPSGDLNFLSQPSFTKTLEIPFDLALQAELSMFFLKNRRIRAATTVKDGDAPTRQLKQILASVADDRCK